MRKNHENSLATAAGTFGPVQVIKKYGNFLSFSEPNETMFWGNFFSHLFFNAYLVSISHDQDLK